jgi:hypothetical protein
MDVDGVMAGESRGDEEGATFSFGTRSPCLGLVFQAMHDGSGSHEVAQGDVESRPQELP